MTGLLAAALLLAAGGAEPAAGEAPALDLRVSLKAGALVERRPADPLVQPERNGGAGLWRLRVEGAGRPAARAALAAAWETRLRVDSAPAAGPAGAGPLPAGGPAPFRIRQLDWPIAEGRGLSWRHEVDRASAALEAGPARLTAGRQAVGWGRGALFGAVDLFAPFAPLEVDREWRRGVDALRGELRLGERSGAEAVVAGAERAGDMAAAGRLRAAAGDADGELVAGWRAGDWLAGLAASGAVGDAEVHAEACLFRAREPLPAGGDLGDARLALKAVAGASRRFAVGNGLLLLAEWHYSGFGARRAGDLPALLALPSFQRRLLRGDAQIPGRHAAAASAAYEVSPLLSASLALLVSTADGSGLAVPQLRVDPSDRLSVIASAYLPWGAGPDAGRPRSDLGATPVTGFVQIAVYE